MLSELWQNLKIQMKDFEVSAEPVQNWLSKTERLVQESSNRLYDLPAKRREQQKLQVMDGADFTLARCMLGALVLANSALRLSVPSPCSDRIELMFSVSPLRYGWFSSRSSPLCVA